MNKFIALFSLRKILESRTVSTRLTADGKEIPKRKHFENRITLIGTDNSVTITDLSNAQSLSLRRELKLVKVQDVDSKTRRPVYRLLTNAEYHAEELVKRKEKQDARHNSPVKGEKLLTLSTRIGENDLMTGVKKMLKLLEKQYEVRVVIAGVGEGDASIQTSERIYSVIEKSIKPMGKVVQKRVKGNSLRFQLQPSKEINTHTPNDLDSNKNGNDKGPL